VWDVSVETRLCECGGKDLIMFHDEFVFEFGGKEYKFQDLDYFDEILSHSVRKWQDNVRRGYVKVFMEKQEGKDEFPRKFSLGTMRVDDIKRKFG
jgi:hypothetical protein